MRKLFTAKPGRFANAVVLLKWKHKSSKAWANNTDRAITLVDKQYGLFLFIIIVAAQWSFIAPDTSKSPLAPNLADTSTTPGGKASSYFSISSKMSVYDSLHLKEAGLSKKVFGMALKGMAKLVKTRHIRENLLAIVDFSQPSNKKRLYVIDLDNYQLLYNTWVAHGMKTGKVVAQYFSNKPASNKSSLGFYVTGPAYQGSNGYSLRLVGVEKGINDYAMKRGIVVHGAEYVNEYLLASQGYIGRSWGCPAVAQEICEPLIDLLKEGSCLFIYHPSQAYRTKSLLLR